MRRYKSPNNIIRRLHRTAYRGQRVNWSLEQAISLVGDKALQHQLTMLGNNAAGFLRKGLREAAKFVKRISKQRCPVRTGTMRRAIKYRVKAHRRNVYAMVYVDPKVIIQLDGKPYRPSKIAPLVEFRRKSFMRSVLADYEDEIVRIITEHTRKELDDFVMDQMWAI